MKTIRLPGLARALLTLIGSWKVHLSVKNKSANFNESTISSFNLNSLEIWKLCSIFETLIVEMALSLVSMISKLFWMLVYKSVSGKRWRHRSNSYVTFLPMACASFTELTLEEIKVSFIIHWFVIAFHSIWYSFSLMFYLILMAGWEPRIYGCDYSSLKSHSGRYGKFNVFKLWC